MTTTRQRVHCALAAAILALCTAATASTPTAAAAPSNDRSSLSAHTHTYRVRETDYTLGDRAFSYPHLDFAHPDRRAPIEITGRVYYPVDHTQRRHPLVVLLHGSWQTCADRKAADAENGALAKLNAWDAAHPGTKFDPGPPDPDEKKLDAIIDHNDPKLNRWPCAPGTPPMPSYQGFGYLGRALAQHGIMAVSISANGVNAVGLGDVAVAARAALINKHLALWAKLDRTGGGPLAGHFTAPGSSHSVHPDFEHRIDLSRIGTLGHSRGGKAVFWQAADVHRAHWPNGVTVRAMVSLAPEGAGETEPGSQGYRRNARHYLVTRVPFLEWLGTCDQATEVSGLDYTALNAGHNRPRDYLLVVHGANHNFLNYEWSPSSHQVEANDDNDTLGVPRPVPGHCTETTPRFPLNLRHPVVSEGKPNAERELTERSERQTAADYVTAFFLRELDGQKRWDGLLSGRTGPSARGVRTQVRVIDARRGA